LKLTRLPRKGLFVLCDFDRVLLALKGQGKDRTQVLENASKRFGQRFRAPSSYWVV
jgi:hypothetical protein